jgi:hypothetical protein
MIKLAIEERSLDELKEEVLNRAKMEKYPMKAPSKLQDVELYLSRFMKWTGTAGPRSGARSPRIM